MKLTPLDIHHKEFRTALRGYNQEEVDSFLDEVADEFERLFKENIELSERLDASEEKIKTYADMEKTLHNTMLAAQQSAEEIQNKARKEAELLLRDAEIKAKELIQGALAEKQRTSTEFMRIKGAEDEFRMNFRNLLEEYMRKMAEIEVPADVAAVTGLADDKIVDLKVAAEQVAASQPDRPEVPAVAAEPAPMPRVEPAPPSEPELLIEPDDRGEAEHAGRPRPQARAARRGENTGPSSGEPPESGFVQSLTLGEVSGPDLRPDTPVFEDPADFQVPQGVHGEHDDDLDIEEID